MFHYVEHIDTITLGEFEQLMLMSIVRLDDEALKAL